MSDLDNATNIENKQWYMHPKREWEDLWEERGPKFIKKKWKTKTAAMVELQNDLGIHITRTRYMQPQDIAKLVLMFGYLEPPGRSKSRPYPTGWPTLMRSKLFLNDPEKSRKSDEDYWQNDLKLDLADITYSRVRLGFSDGDCDDALNYDENAMIRVGSQVFLKEFESQPELSSKKAVVRAFDEAGGVYEVQLDDGGTLLCRSEKLQPVANEDWRHAKRVDTN